MFDVLKRRLIGTRDSRRRHVSAFVTIDSLEVRLLLTAPTMTDSEQYMLELINRARANPSAEAARLGIGLNDGLSAGTITTAAKQPFAPQQELITAARLHSQDMLNRDYFSHTTLGAGTTFSQRVTNAGYIWSGVAENIGFAAKTIAATQTVYINEIHDGLIRSAGHRENIMAPVYEELGIGAKLGSFKPANNPTTFQFTEMVTQDFGSRNLNPIITGIVYTDADSNNFYTIGESIRSGTVSAVNVSTGAVFSDTIGVSGAYGFVVPAGTYTVTATFTLNGATQTFQKPGNVTVGSDNVKVDFETRSGVLVPAAITLTSAVTTLNENGATATTNVTVTRNGSPAASLTVNLSSSDTTEVTIPATVVIPAGQFSATFTASAVNDGIIDGNQTATVTATASGFPATNRSLTVTDRTWPAVPPGIQVVATARPTFTWSAISNAATYEVYVNNVTTNVPRVVNVTGIAATSYTTTVDLPIGTFNVWVRGFTAAGLASGWSPAAVWKLRPTTTVLDSGRTEPSGNFRINWNPIPGASTYGVWINRLTSSTIEYLREPEVDGTTLSVSNFDVGSYGVWVRARNTAGDLVGWSAQGTINVNYAPSGISVIAEDLTSTPSLNWSSVGGASLYDVWIDNLTTGASAVVRNTAVQGTTLELTGLSPASYRAYVRGRDLPGGGFYQWSSGFDFEVGRAPRITAPTGNGQPVRPTINWTSVSGAARYEIWLANLTTGGREIIDANVLTTSYTTTTDLTSSNNYRVWIRAFDGSGAASSWSLSTTFTIAATSLRASNTDQRMSPIGNPLLEHLFVTADTWLYQQVDCVRRASDLNSTDPVELSLPQEPTGKPSEHELMALLSRDAVGSKARHRADHDG
ncbi:MAG: CAP domain-containing protein [Planctomycetaceae bacterium]